MKKEAIIQPAYSKNEIIILLQKALNDYNMIDCKVKEILNVESIESRGKVFEERNEFLTICSRKRNIKIEELIETVGKEINLADLYAGQAR